MLGDKLFAIFSNSAFVITVLQSAAAVLEGESVALAVEAEDLSAAAFAADGFGAGGQTPFIVRTGASGGTAAEVSAGVPGAWGEAAFPAGPWLDCGGGGAACPHASAPNSTHIDQLLRINSIPPGLLLSER